MARDRVRRNVIALCSVPAGQAGRPSKALTLAQAKAVLVAARASRLHAYVVVSLLTGARTEELRALTWDHLDLDSDPNATPPIPPHIASGDQSAAAVTLRLASPDERSPCQYGAPMLSAS
jgi:hypothetical protein